jgi:hypothetical protein
LSVHLIECAAKATDLLPAEKLVLLAFADSADRQTRIAFPGLDNVQTGACVSRSRALELVGKLVDKGLLRKHRGGHRGRRAEYVVFPAGCCSDCLPIEEPTAAVSSTTVPANGSGTSDSGHGEASDPSYPKRGPSPAPSTGSGPLDPVVEKGSGKGPVATGPLLNSNYIPPNPQASPGGASCAKHPKAPHPNCRGCGTTARQIRETAIVEARVAKRDRELERVRRRTAAEAAAAADSQTPAVQELLQRARAAITGGAA